MAPRPPVPHSHKKLQFKKCVWPKMAGTRVTLKKYLWPTRSIPSGEIAPNSQVEEHRSSLFLARKWNRELDYRLIKELWAFRENQIAVRFRI